MSFISLSRMGLQNMVTIAYKYSRKWKFRFNPSKCIVLTFGNTSDKESIKLGDVVYIVAKIFVQQCIQNLVMRWKK